MSRTDAHRPYRVRAADELEPGRYARHHHVPAWFWFHLSVDRTDCDLGEHPYAKWRDPDHDNCTWELDTWVFRPYRKSNRRDRRAYGHKPDRARTRRQLRAVMQLEDIEDWDVWSPQARHSVDWLVS